MSWFRVYARFRDYAFLEGGKDAAWSHPAVYCLNRLVHNTTDWGRGWYKTNFFTLAMEYLSFRFLLRVFRFCLTFWSLLETLILLNGFRFSSLVIRRTEVRLTFRSLEISRWDLCVPGWSSWDTIISSTSVLLSSLTAVLGLPLPCFLLVDPVSLIFLIC